MVENGTVVISLDAELMWGAQQVENDNSLSRWGHGRESWVYLLDLFGDYRIPATWAIVGHLFLEKCSGTHSNHPIDEEWFSRDPGGEYSSESHWFGPDLIDMIINSTVSHDIGSHSFSHVQFGETTEEIAKAELEYSINAIEKYSLNPDSFNSFVFPVNNINHRNLIAEYDFTCYRGLSPDRWYDREYIRKFGKVITYVFGLSSPPIVNPKIDKYGLVNIPASMYLFTFDVPGINIIESVTSHPVISQVKQGLDQLEQQNRGVLHLWLHPNNLTEQRNCELMNELISLISEYRDQSNIEVKTMAQISSQIKNN